MSKYRTIAVRPELAEYLEAVAERGVIGENLDEVVDSVLVRAVTRMMLDRWLECADEELGRARGAIMELPSDGGLVCGEPFEALDTEWLCSAPRGHLGPHRVLIKTADGKANDVIGEPR